MCEFAGVVVKAIASSKIESWKRRNFEKQLATHTLSAITRVDIRVNGKATEREEQSLLLTVSRPQDNAILNLLTLKAVDTRLLSRVLSKTIKAQKPSTFPMHGQEIV